MKRSCKDVDITDRGLISRAVYACLRKKYKRNDTIKFLSGFTVLTGNQIRYILHRGGKAALRAVFPLLRFFGTGVTSSSSATARRRVSLSSGSRT